MIHYKSNVDWKKQLSLYEHNQEWDAAIEFMQNIIRENPNDMDAYLLMNYLLMNLLVEEDFDKSKMHYYTTLIKWYFDESRAKFSKNPEYLYFTGKTAVMSEWYFGISDQDYRNMLEKAHRLDPDNVLYNENYFRRLRKEDPENPELITFIQMILNEDSSIRKQLQTKGALGEYIFEMKEHWVQGILRSNALKNREKAN